MWNITALGTETKNSMDSDRVPKNIHLLGSRTVSIKHTPKNINNEMKPDPTKTLNSMKYKEDDFTMRLWVTVIWGQLNQI